MLRRRELLLMPLAAVPLATRAAAPPSLAAAWREGRQACVGLLQPDEVGAYRPRAGLEVPTRAHGLAWASDGTLLSVARRPGEWLQRQSAEGRLLVRQWAEPDRCFNGHLLAAADGSHLFSTETAQDRDGGLIVLRSMASLEPLAEWASGGRDPHQLLQDEGGDLWVANGGIPAQAETGRMKRQLAQMDASLARLEGRGGALRDLWRLGDSRLSLRHLAWGPSGMSGQVGDRPLLGIALQAEHEDPAERAAAPLLALFDGQRLRACANPPLAGYGGDIAWTGSHWCVSATRANCLAFWHADGRWAGTQVLAGAGALAWRAGRLLAGCSASLGQGLTLDNHWLAAAAGPQKETRKKETS